VTKSVSQKPAAKAPSKKAIKEQKRQAKEEQKRQAAEKKQKKQKKRVHDSDDSSVGEDDFDKQFAPAKKKAKKVQFKVPSPFDEDTD